MYAWQVLKGTTISSSNRSNRNSYRNFAREECQPLEQAMATIAKFQIFERESTAYPTGLLCVANEYARRS